MKNLTEKSPSEVAVQFPQRTAKSMLESEKKYFIKSYGCQMNVYDSQRMGDALTNDGYVESKEITDADLIILNTCHIREKAVEKLYSEIGRIRKLKEKKKEEDKAVQVVVAGCVAQAHGKEILRRQPTVDIVIGPQNYHRISRLIKKSRSGERIVDTEFPIENKFDYLPKPNKDQAKKRSVSSFVTIQEGCDKFCTFCVVPYTRGAEYSRPVADILNEIYDLTAGGVREVTLIGQNVNAYHGLGLDGKMTSLAELISSVSKNDKVSRIRYSTSHPRDMNIDLVKCHATQPKLMPYLHLPVQSGSDRILSGMNRQHTASEYIGIIDAVRAQRPDIALSSDFIVGFPGETDSDFEETMQLVERVQFASAYSFKYSSRPGTPGSEMDDSVPEEMKSQRLARLQSLLNKQRRRFNDKLVGQEVTILIEKVGRYDGQVVGKTPYLQTVQLNADINLIGTVVTCRIIEVASNSLFGELLP